MKIIQVICGLCVRSVGMLVGVVIMLQVVLMEDNSQGNDRLNIYLLFDVLKNEKHFFL